MLLVSSRSSSAQTPRLRVISKTRYLVLPFIRNHRRILCELLLFRNERVERETRNKTEPDATLSPSPSPSSPPPTIPSSSDYYSTRPFRRRPMTFDGYFSQSQSFGQVFRSAKWERPIPFPRTGGKVKSKHFLLLFRARSPARLTRRNWGTRGWTGTRCARATFRQCST